MAVRTGPGEEELEVRAPLVISDAGIFNTFGKLLPPHVRCHPGKVALVSLCPQSLGVPSGLSVLNISGVPGIPSSSSFLTPQCPLPCPV